MATSTSSVKQSRKSKATSTSGPGGPWSGHAPRRLRKAYQGDSDEQGWALWCKHLAKRKLRTVPKLFKGQASPLLWALPPGTDTEAAERIIELLRRPQRPESRTAELDNAALRWLSQADVAAQDVGFAVECLAWCGALPALCAHLDERDWWQLANRLIAIATAERHDDDPLVTQMLHGELPAALAYSFPELAACGSLVAASRRTLETAGDDLFGPDAMVHGSQLDELRPLLACWTRWRRISNELEASIWRGTMPRCYARLVEYALRLSRADGAQLFSPPGAAAWSRRMIKTAIDLAGSARTERVAQWIASGGKGSGNPRRRRPAASFDLESAGLAVLRSNWRRRSPQLAVNYSGPQLQLELGLGRRRFCSGAVEIDLRIDDRPVVPRQGWEQVCWESDRETDYLELELRFSEDIAIQRHLVLAREGGFLLLADAVLGAIPRKISYRATLPLAEAATFQLEEETREGTLHAGGSARARVLPLALSEWRSGPADGTLAADQDGPMVLEQESQGCSMFAPLFIDLDSRRLRSEATWRQLTVGEDRQVVPRDTAVGYRVQVGKQQWLVYRSLGDVGVRTVLGQNLRHEFLLGRFGSGGDVKKLLEIEA